MTSNENILYYINEHNVNDNDNLNQHKENKGVDISALYDEYNFNPNNHAFTYDDYMTNYTVKQLTHILHYYKLNIGRLRKNEIVQLIILFESEYENHLIVNQRQKLWSCMNELKTDNYLSKFIIFNI